MKTHIWLIALMPLMTPVIAHAQENTVIAQTQKVDEPNARLELARAAKALVGKESFGVKQNLEGERKLVAENAPALRILHEALQLPFQAEALPENASDRELAKIAGEMMKPLAEYRRMARLLATESRVRAADKNFAGAVQSGTDAQSLGVLVRSDGTLIQMLVGVAIEAIARRQLRELLPQLDDANARIALRDVQRNAVASPTYTQILRYEADWSRIAYEPMLEDVPQPIAQQMRAQWGALMQQEIAHSKVPYIISEQQARGGVMDEEFLDDLDDEETIPDELTAEIVPALVAAQFATIKNLYQTSRLSYENNRTQNALLLADFALRAYELEHGKPATNWDEIVPAYLPQAPADPFDYEHSLRLTTREGKAAAYSIGPDGLDDKGAPIDNGTEAGTQRFRVEFNNRGDIVSGVNMQ